MTQPPCDTKLSWDADGVPVSTRFADRYHAADGLAEARHVFLAGNGLPAAWAGRGGFRIAELGFGTGLSVLAARALWRATRATRARGAVLEVTSFEADPLSRAQIGRALARWPELDALAAELLAVWPPAGGSLDFGDTRLEVIVGDARETLPRWPGQADAWFLDGFAPARNPELWEPALLQAAHDRTAPGGGFATYTAAGHVRRALAAAGFAVTRRPGFPPKREMTVGRRG
jgi:tRNA U34 5-methylaminomethyl-2-thiouridine-forming methyltransferase MnmC